MTQLSRRRIVLAKIETTYGTDPTPSGAANAILLRNLNVNPLVAEQVGREVIRPFLGNFEQLNANTHVELDFEVEMAGSGAAGTAPAYGPLLRACGLSETITAVTKVEYAPISSAMESATIYVNSDGVNHKITGWRGNVEFGLNASQIPVFKFKGVGLYNPPTDTALPTPTYTGFITPVIANTANTTPFSLYGTTSFVLQSLSLNLNNDVSYRSLIGAQRVDITDRKPAGEIVIEAVALATKDFFAISQAGTLGALSLTHGTVSGNIVQLDCAQIDIGNPDYQDFNGVNMLKIPFQPIPSTGNDDFKITVK